MTDYSHSMAPIPTVGQVPTATAGTGFMEGFKGLAGKDGVLDLGIGAIGTFATAWNAFQQNKLAKKSLGLQERAFETNLANQKKTYNTSLEDRINARFAAEGRSGQAANYIKERTL